MPEPDARHFLPFRRSDIVEMCRRDEALDANASAKFESAVQHIEQCFLFEFDRLKRQLKDAYAPLDPDSDTRCPEDLRCEPAELAPLVEQVLARGNYEKISDSALKDAFKTASLFQVRLYVDMADFEEVLLYYRGSSQCSEKISSLFGLRRRTVTFNQYERVVLYLRFRQDIDADSTLGGCRPGSTMLKLFQNVPDADLEMLFPNTRVGMRWLDRVLIAVPAVVSGGMVLTTKLGATLVLLGSLLGFWLGVHGEPVELDRAALVVLAAGIAALGGYLWKQFSSFKNRKLKYTQALTRNLYFKLLDNNAGVLYRVVDDGEESECKEAVLAYYFLLRANQPCSAQRLDRNIEQWFAQRWQCPVNFDVADALGKLEKLGLAHKSGEDWSLADTLPWDSATRA